MLSILAQRAVCLLLMDPPRSRIRHDAPARMGAAADYLVERLECSPQQASLAESKMLPNALDKMAPHSAMLLHSDRGGAVDGGDGAVLSMLHGHGADGVDMDIGLAPSWKGTLYGPPLAATLAVEAALCNKAPQAMLPPGTLSSARLT